MDPTANDTWIGRPASLRRAGVACILCIFFLGIGTVWVSGYAVTPADDVSQGEGIALTATYGFGLLLIMLLGIACHRARPGTWRRTRALAMVNLALGTLLLLLAALGFLLFIVLRIPPPRMPILLVPDPNPGLPMFICGLLAYASLQQPETQRWFGQSAPQADAV